MWFEIYRGNLMGDWFWRLKSANGRVVADGSEPYSSKSGARRAVNNIVDALQDGRAGVEIRYAD